MSGVNIISGSFARLRRAISAVAHYAILEQTRRRGCGRDKLRLLSKKNYIVGGCYNFCKTLLFRGAFAPREFVVKAATASPAATIAVNCI